MVWSGYDEEASSHLIWYADNAGGEWSYPEMLSPDDDWPYYPVIAVEPGGTSRVIFHGHNENLDDGNCSCLYVTNAGGEWSYPVLLSDHYGQNGSYLMQLELDPLNHPHVAFDGDDGMIHYTTDQGSGWIDSVIISTQNENSQYAPGMALDAAGNPHVAWEGYDDEYEQEKIWYAEDISRHLVSAEVEGGHGAVDPAAQLVPDGGQAAVDLMPDPGYRVASLTDNGIPQAPSDPYIIDNVTVDHHVVVSYEKAENTWYLPEGCTLDGFETWVLVANPGPTPAKVNLAFDTGAGEVVRPELQDLTVPARSRSSFPLSPYIQSYDVATRVISGSEVVCERATYGPGSLWATESVGVTRTSDAWYLAEGCTGTGFETWLLVQNPNDSAVRVNIAMDTESGRVQKPELQDLIMPAHTRASWDLARYYVSWDVAIEVTSEEGGVVAERSMYAPDHAWATSSVGAPVTSDAWYLAEGCTLGMETWVLVQNPGANPVKVDVKYLTESGVVQGPREVIPAYTRRSYNAGDTVLSNDVASLVTSQYGEVVVERAMYGPGRSWGTCSVGSPAPAATWYLAEGCTLGMDTWVLVANPGATPAVVNLALQTESGQVLPPDLQGVTVPAGCRRTFHLNDYVTTYNVSTKVTASSPVVCERAMYGPEGTWATDSIGYTPPDL